MPPPMSPSMALEPEDVMSVACGVGRVFGITAATRPPFRNDVDMGWRKVLTQHFA